LDTVDTVRDSQNYYRLILEDIQAEMANSRAVELPEVTITEPAQKISEEPLPVPWFGLDEYVWNDPCVQYFWIFKSEDQSRRKSPSKSWK
jgi:hypothetical protein